jgi:lipid-binding SYLF domain-containing protein
MKFAFAILLVMVSVACAGESSKPAERLGVAATVLDEIMQAPDKSIPHDLLESARCIVIVPGVKKGAFIVGAKYGKGCVTCRTKDGQSWTAPGNVRMEGASVGFQWGGSETDVVMLVMNERGAARLLKSKFTLGADASVAAGPVGRESTAETDAYLTAEILSWSRSRGAFAGVALNGSTLREDLEDNRTLYGRTLENHEIIQGELPVPESAKKLVATLEKYSPLAKR